MARVTIITVTYNGLEENTRPCLESLLAGAMGPEDELVVVDNQSTDGTPAYLRELALTDPRVRPLFNDTNRGFAGGNNDGLRAARGDLLVLLNNDTLLAPGWLEPLVATLEADRGVGLVGPVSNSVGNEQKIHTRGADPETVLGEGAAWVALSAGDRFETERLAFFCAAMRRDVYERVGPLDEEFGLGFYEDDDYCLRARAAGYRLVCAEDSFVYHRGSASFRRASTLTKDLLTRNRALLERKHGPYRVVHRRDRHLALVASYLERMRREGQSARLSLKALNRLREVARCLPRSPLHRYRYRRRLQAALLELLSC